MSMAAQVLALICVTGIVVGLLIVLAAVVLGADRDDGS
jgi:hypothetical protein